MLIVKGEIGEHDLNTFTNHFVKTPVLKFILWLKKFRFKVPADESLRGLFR